MNNNISTRYTFRDFNNFDLGELKLAILFKKRFYLKGLIFVTSVNQSGCSKLDMNNLCYNWGEIFIIACCAYLGLKTGKQPHVRITWPTRTSRAQLVRIIGHANCVNSSKQPCYDGEKQKVSVRISADSNLRDFNPVNNMKLLSLNSILTLLNWHSLTVLKPFFPDNWKGPSQLRPKKTIVALRLKIC